MSLIPLAVLVAFLALTINLFGGDAIAGGSQLSLLTASAVCTAMAIGWYRCRWQQLEDAITHNMRSATPALIILLLIEVLRDVLVILIGGSFGMAESLKKEAWVRLSMSPMTFPHHLARIMVLEQIYRAEAIQAGSKYHK